MNHAISNHLEVNEEMRAESPVDGLDFAVSTLVSPN
jgi:hypothetical protein